MQVCPRACCVLRKRPFNTASSRNPCSMAEWARWCSRRGATSRYIAFGCFLLDVFCLGVKDVMFGLLEGEAFDTYMDVTDAASPLVSVDPGYARKLVRDLAAWSQSIGFAPHREFAAVEQIFGDVDADASDAAFQFGCDGKPLYIPGPNDTAPLIRRRIERLRQFVGDDGFDFETAA
jgi:hypothetical protein